jgi:hypothetical protein
MSSSSRASKNAKITASGRPFARGNPGGPGRPQGSRNKATLALDRLADGDAEAILQKQLEKAKAGDGRASEMVLSRVWPLRKGRLIELSLPPIKAAADLVEALGALADAVVAGSITPDEGQAVAGILEAKRKAIETTALEARITALEIERRNEKH